ncbi:MAG: response regulator transcription factor [Opitutaceae bacterium]
MTQTAPIRVFLVDDHPVLLEGLRAFIDQQDGFVVCGTAREARTAIEQIRDTDPAVCVLDISLNGIHGLDLLRLLRTENSTLKILCYSLHEELFYAERSLRSGAMGYVMKNEEPEVFLSALRKVSAGEIHVSERIGKQMLNQIARGSSRESGSGIDQLSNRELQVIQYIGENCNNRIIAERMHVSVKTVEAHRSRIKDKLKLNTSYDLIRFAVRWVEYDSDPSKQPILN